MGRSSIRFGKYIKSSNPSEALSANLRAGEAESGRLASQPRKSREPNAAPGRRAAGSQREDAAPVRLAAAGVGAQRRRPARRPRLRRRPRPRPVGLWQQVHSLRVGGLQRDAEPPDLQPCLALLLHFRRLGADGHLHPGLPAPRPLQLVLRRWTLGPRLDQDLLGGLGHPPLLPPGLRLRPPRWHGRLLQLHSEIQSGSQLPRGSAASLGQALSSRKVLRQPLRCPGHRLGELLLLVLDVLPALRGMHPQSPLPARGGRQPPARLDGARHRRPFSLREGGATMAPSIRTVLLPPSSRG